MTKQQNVLVDAPFYGEICAETNDTLEVRLDSDALSLPEEFQSVLKDTMMDVDGKTCNVCGSVVGFYLTGDADEHQVFEPFVLAGSQESAVLMLCQECADKAEMPYTTLGE